MDKKIFWKMFFFIHLISSIYNLYQLATLPPILQPEIPLWLGVINLVILPFILICLYAYAYSSSLRKLFKNKVFCCFFIAGMLISDGLSMYFEFNAGGYSAYEMYALSFITLIFITPVCYVVVQLLEQNKSTNH